MRILITGGAGFMGSNFVRYSLAKHPDYNFIILDKLTYAGRMDNLREVVDKIKFVKGDICDKRIIEKTMKGVDCVIHFAAETHVDRSIDNANSFILTNVYGTYRLLEAVKKFDIERFIFISSDEVYGSVERGPFKEDSEFRPSSPYSASKASADLLCQSYHKTYGLPLIIVRPSNNFGFYQFPEKLIPRFVILALQDKNLPLFGNGLQRREWLYVQDCSEAIDLILHKGGTGETYNVGGGKTNERTNLWIAKFILNELNKPESLIRFVKDRPGHDMRYSLNSSKVRNLGWRPKWKLEDALRKTIQWYADNLDYWRPLTELPFVSPDHTSRDE
jgi:dTDP-glucose 4,6-dehydratase